MRNIRERESAHAPGKAHPDSMAPNFGGMEMQKHVGRHHHDAVTRRVVITVAKNRLPNMAFDDVAS